MEEFIVWDEDNYFGEDNQFYTKEELKKVAEDFTVFDLDFISENEPFINTYMDDGEYTNGWKKVKIKIFWSIGKTDIAGNKIYADRSIVEAHVTFANDESKSVTGYFTYKERNLSYCFQTENYPPLIFSDGGFKNLKIIGSLQENPELLKGESDEDN